ncbi:oxidoreductase [Mycolicibacterium aromaticivorans JS19b1 = JCM 16368]|uniref:Oxidoreductase n=1 Tax=Mycolicibacterium aromaticivorans JS19b1 = JCM 16368 TaxID=1440774 RepID=A0A064CDD3_9MYCO|nr:NAD(P)-dependent oxidoreductase [Mycolicibacterium aromaticivorans]KDE97701.1 oxidoreductase [Mycolicibacterium aromaticivorans JS19b1 = JCM 16368]
MDLGFIGLGNMGLPIATRLIEAGHPLVVFDTRPDIVAQAVDLGAQAASSPRDVADRAETVLASLPSVLASREVALGTDGVIEGRRVERFIDLSTVGSTAAQQIQTQLAQRGIAMLDSPVSGGVGGAAKGTLTLMVSGPRDQFEIVEPILARLGTPFFVDTKPGAGQTMKLVNNLLAATALAATSEVVVMGVKAGLDPSVMIEVINAGSGATNASRDKFPKSILPRSFDYGFATGLMVKDVRLYLEEAEALGLPTEVAAAVGRLWELVLREEGPESDFTTAIKPIEAAAGVIVDGRPSG